MSDTDSHEWHLIHNTWVAGCNVCGTIGYSHFDGYRQRWLAEFRSLDLGRLAQALGPHPQDPVLRRQRAEEIAGRYSQAQTPLIVGHWDPEQGRHVGDLP